MDRLRDPLVLAYEAIKAAIREVHGEAFAVFDDAPDATKLKKQLPAASISYISGSSEKAFMREFEPHAIKKNKGGTFTVATETLRFEYYIQVSFFSHEKGLAQRLSTQFYTKTEQENEIPLLDEPWNETMQIFLESPPLPPRGEPDLYQCDQTWACRGRLLTTEVVNAVDVRKLKLKIHNKNKKRDR